MAISLINTECKRYGCIKNLLACYANCRYSTRCEDLRNEIIDKTELASSDINKYLGERGRTPITIQLMKRGLKFADAVKAESRSAPVKKTLLPIKTPEPVKVKNRVAREIDSVKKLASVLKRTRKRAVMARRPEKELTPVVSEKEQTSSPPAQAQQSNPSDKAMMTKQARPKKRNSPSGSRSAERNGKVYIIIEGKSANIVDEQALMMHLFTNPTSGARYFEASEVEARVQIVKK